MISHEFAIIAPVPLRHLESGLETCREHGRVAFGSMDWEFFRDVDSRRGDSNVSVFIYASLDEGKLASSVVSWQGVYVGHVQSRRGRPPAGYHFRPKSTQKDLPSWVVFWEVSKLDRLDEPIKISSFRGNTRSHSRRPQVNYLPSLIPRGPLLIEYPALL